MSPEVSHTNIFWNKYGFHVCNKVDVSLLNSFLTPTNFPLLADRGVGILVAQVEGVGSFVGILVLGV